MESYPLPHLSTTVHLALFSPLSNAASLRTRLVAASQLPAHASGDAERAAVDFSFVDASKVTSRLHVLTAVTQALLAQAEGTMRTKTVHSELLYMLEPSLSISDSLKHFGLSPSTKSLLLVHIAAPSSSSARAPPPQGNNDEVLQRMEAIVEGSPLGSLETLGQLGEGGVDEKGLRKVYKLNADSTLASLHTGTPEALDALDRLLTSAVAVKTVA